MLLYIVFIVFSSLLLDCDSKEFKCKSGQIIPIDRLHNGFKDCYDGSDEDCLNNQHKCLCGLPVCLDKSRVNDGIKDCIDGSDEGHADTNLCRYDTTELAVGGAEKNAGNNDKLATSNLVSVVVSNVSAPTSAFTQSSTEASPLSSSSLPSISSPLIAPASTTDDVFVEVTGTFVPYEQLRPFRPAVASSVIALPQYSSIVPAGSRSVIEITGTLLPGAAQESTPVTTPTSTRLLVKTSRLSASVAPTTEKDEDAKVTTESPSPFITRNIEQTRFLVTTSRAPLSKSTNKVKLYTGFVSINGTKYNLLTVSNGTENTEVTITINEFDNSNGKVRNGNRRIKPGEVGVNLDQFGLTINLPSTLNKMISSRDLLLGNADANNNLKYTTIMISDANKVKFDQTTGSNGLLLNQDKSRRMDSSEGSDLNKDELVDLLKLSVAVETSLDSKLKNIVVKQSTAVEVNDSEAKQSSKAKHVPHQSGTNRALSEPNEQFVAYGLENSDVSAKIVGNQFHSSGPTVSSITPSHVNLPTRTVIDSLNELAVDSETPASSKYQITPPLESVSLVSKSVPVYERPTLKLRVDPINTQTKASGLIGTTTIFGFIDFTTTINGSLVIFTPNTQQLAAKNDKRKWKSTSSGLIQPTTASSIVSSTSSLHMSSILASSINLRDNLKLRSRLGSKIRPKIGPTATQPSIVETSESIFKLKSGKYESINFNPIASSKDTKLNSRQSIIQSGLSPSVTYQSVNRQSASLLAFKPTSVQPTGLLSSFTGTISANHSLTEWTTLVIGTYIKGTYAHILESKSRIYPKQEVTLEPSNLMSFIQPSNKPLLQPSSSSSFSVSSSSSASSVQSVPNRISPKPDSIKPSHQITITSGFILPSAASSIDSSSTATFNTMAEKPNTLEPSSLPSSSSIGLSSSMIEPETTSSSRQFESTESLDETIRASSSEFSSPYSSSTSALTFTPIRAHVTTYTYFTTYFKDGSMLVSSHKEIVTNTQSATKQTSKIVPTSSSKVLPPVTFYTTYTYYSTLVNGGSQTIKTREEIVSHVSKPGEKVNPITLNSIVPTQSLSLNQPQSTVQPSSSSSSSISSIPSSTPLLPSSSLVKLEASSTDTVSRKSIAPARTYYTTFTYFTTYLRGGSKSIVSRFETITNVASGDNNMDETSSAVIAPSLIKPSAALTRYTTYTFYTTHVRSGSTVVSTSKKTITNVATIPKEIVRPTGSLRNSIKQSKSARTELITFTYFTTTYNQGKPTVSSRFETITSVISPQAFGQRSVSSIKPSLSSTLSSTVINNNLLSPSVTFDQPFPTENPSLIDSSFANLKSFESSSSLNDVHLSSSKTPELPVVPEIKDMTSIDISSLLAGLKVPITRYTTYTYFTTLGQGISRSTVTRTQVVSNVVTDTIKLSLPSASSSSLPNLSSPINEKNISTGLQLNRRAPVLDELEVASNENRPQHAHDKPVTFYTTTTHYTTILLPTGGSTILSNIDVRASVTRLANDQVLPTRQIDSIPERESISLDLPRNNNNGNAEVTTLSSSISPPSRYDYGTNQVEVVSTVNIHRTHETDPLLTYETSLTYLTTYFDQTKPIRTETRRETVTEIRRNTLINPSVTRKPLIIRRTRLRGAAARDISLDPRDGSHLTRKPVVVITKKPIIEPTVILDRPFASDHFPRDFNRHRVSHVDEPGLAPTPVTYYTTFTHFTTELVGGLPVVRSREQIFSTVITDRVLPTRTGFGLRPSIGLRAKRSTNDGDDLIMEESNLDPMAFEIPSGQIVSKMKDNETNDDSMKPEYSDEPIETEDESSSKTVKPIEEMDPTPSLDSIGVNPSSKVGIISSHVSSVVQNGQTTLYTTQIYGTYIGTIYAHLAKTQTSLLPSSSSSYQIDPASSSLPIGLISESVRSEINLGTTTLFKTQVHGTFINGVYAHFGQVTSNLIAPSVSTNSKIELTQTPISVLISTEINNDITTLHTSEIYSTMISGFSAQFTRATSSVVEPTATNQSTVSFSGSSTSTRPFIVFPSRKRSSNLNNSNANELVNQSTTSIHTQTVTKTVTATPVVDASLNSLIVETNLEDQDESEPVDNNNANKNSIANNDDELHEAECFDNREGCSEKVEVGHDEYDSVANEDVHHEDAVEHPNSRTGRSSRHRPTREKSRYYDYEAPAQPSSNNDDTDYGSDQSARYNGRYSGYVDPYSAQPVQPVAAPAAIPTPVPAAAPQGRYKGVFGQRVGASSRSSSSSPTSSSFANDYDPYTNYGTSAPITPKSQPALIPHSRGRFAANDQIGVDRQNNYPAPQAQTQPASRPVEVLQPFQNLHETLSDRTYNSNGVTASPGRRSSNRQSSSQSGRRRSSSNPSSRSNSGDLSDTLGVTPRTTQSERALVARYQTPKRSQVEAQPANGRSSRNRGGNRGQPVTPSYIVNDPPVARAYDTEEPVEDPIIEENVYVEPSTRGRNHFAVSSRNRGTGKTRRIILNNPEPSRPPAIVLPAYTPSPSLIFASSITESPNLSIPDASKTAITITSLVSVVKTLPIRHGFLTSYATITTTAFNKSVINPNEYQLRLNPTNTAETLTIFDSSTIDPTKVRETLITTTTLLEVKLVPIRIGFSTRTDTLTDTQVLTTFVTSDKTIHPTIHHAYPGYSFPPSGVHNDPAAAAAGIGGPSGASPYLQTGLPYPHGGVIGGGGQLSFSQVTATITGTTTLTSTKVVSLALHGKTLLSTLTLSSTLETTSVTTSLVPVSLAPSQPIFVTTQPPVVTTSLTIHITGDSGDVTELITVLTIPGQVFHTKAIRSIRSTPVQYDQMIPIEKTLAPSLS
ncbi:mucin-3A-like isoform X2 [Tetranychus urticae]|uniref:DUF4758 domain-containing protein n=1 Tax=Tetranychus urticae TaxID=32264 RepID=T1K8F3_TETUR|nr:mucin-3A-like isoform X2 [Tetranychus urticae]